MKKSNIRDYGLVAFLMYKGFDLVKKSDGSFSFDGDDIQRFNEVRQEYFDKYKKTIDGIKKIKKSIS